MAIEKGDIRTSVNYEVMAKKPLDARELKPTKASLFDKESWSYGGDNVYIQEGLKVFVQDEKKLYLLVDETKYDTEEGWEVIATGELAEMEQVVVIDSLDSEDTTAALSANQGRVLKEMIEEGITEEKEVYIGTDTPTDDGAKLWINPTGTPSQPSDYATKEYVDNAIYNVLNSSF